VLKGSFVWDLPDVPSSDGLNVIGLVVNDWQLSGTLTAGSGAPYHVTYAYQTAGANVNITGSSNYDAAGAENRWIRCSHRRARCSCRSDFSFSGGGRV
jgi:hypothetical protein